MIHRNIVKPFRDTRWGTVTVYLPGDEPPEGTTPPDSRPPIAAFVFMPCDACGTSMQSAAMDVEDGTDGPIYLCRDADACAARIRGQAETPGTDSYVMHAISTLATRVDELEKWRRTAGTVLAAPGAVVEAAPGPTYPDLERNRRHIMARIGQVGHTLVKADARRVPMDDESVDLIVTSPPYWAQRSYTDSCPDCAERAKANTRNYMERYCPSCGEVRNRNVCAQCNVSTLRTDATKALSKDAGDCKTCGGKGRGHYAGQIGDEPTYTEFLDNLVACTRDWMCVLKPSGSIWVNLGDKWAGGGGQWAGDARTDALRTGRDVTGAVTSPFRQKSLMGLPWRYALRCIDELGLILRQEVIWSKPNGMPESVTDRCRRSHEQWFHFTKQPTYYSAVDRIREPTHRGGLTWAQRKASGARTHAPDNGHMSGGPGMAAHPLGSLPPSVWEVATGALTVPAEVGADHFAAFPMELPRRIIQGFSPQDVCVSCGEGRRPVKTVVREGGRIRQKVDNRYLGRPGDSSATGQDAIGAHTGYKTVHHVIGDICACTPVTSHQATPTSPPQREYHLDDWTAPATRPGVVLDPFGGTGTTALVAEMHGRHGVHLDMSHDYLKIAEWRTNDPAQRASALQVPKPPAQLPGQLDFMDLLGGADNAVEG